MKLTFITNARAPYRIKQLEKISMIDDYEIIVYYTDKNLQGRNWNVDEIKNIKETQLPGFLLSKKHGYLNFGLTKIVKESDVVVIGGYEQPTYILISLICKILKKPFVLFYDGISTDRISKPENKIKKFLKSLVINNCRAIWGNGKVSKDYFVKKFNYDRNKIVNQCLTVDVDRIKSISEYRADIRKELRQKYNIPFDKKVIMYSGRVIDIKNLKIVVDAISKIKEDMVFFIAGGGQLENELMNYSREKGVQTQITGFIKDQEELFKHYSISDIFILPSIIEPWGLVVNEAMAASLPILVSSICGCSMDLVEEGINGYTFDPYKVDDLVERMIMMMNQNIKHMGQESNRIISEWTFDKSSENFVELINLI